MVKYVLEYTIKIISNGRESSSLQLFIFFISLNFVISLGLCWRGHGWLTSWPILQSSPIFSTIFHPVNITLSRSYSVQATSIPTPPISTTSTVQISSRATRGFLLPPLSLPTNPCYFLWHGNVSLLSLYIHLHSLLRFLRESPYKDFK